jgi:TolB-like protein
MADLPTVRQRVLSDTPRTVTSSPILISVQGLEQNRLGTHTAKSIRGKWSLNRNVLLAICLLLVGPPPLALIYLRISGESKEPEKASAIRSMAVLPFKTLGTEGSEEYLGLGMADTLINRLGHIRQIVLRPTNAIRKYSLVGQDPLIAGRELSVNAVVEGNIQRQGEGERVTVHLIRVPDGVSLWTKKFDDKFTDLFAMEDRLSIEIAQALTQPLSSDEQRLLAKHSTENAQAYQAYLKGRYFWNKRSEEGYQKALEYLGHAIEKDPAYAQAYAGLADSYALLGAMGNASLPASEAIPKAKKAALKALEIDDTPAEAHTSLAFVHMHHEWDGRAPKRSSSGASSLIQIMQRLIIGTPIV